MVVKSIEVELVYAHTERQFVTKVIVPMGATVRHVIERSRVIDSFPEIDLEHNRVGVFSVFRKLDDPVAPGDRVEVYRRLSVEPKEARRRRDREQTSKSE